ncbi:DUF998 domain-containing protein [Actinophytocola sp. KF-1]
MILTVSGACAALAALLCVDLLNLDHAVLDPVAHMASYFVHARAGWLITVVGLGCALAAFAVVPRLRRGPAIAVAVFGAGLLVAGVVPTQAYGDWSGPSAATVVHGLGGWLAFLALPVAAWLARRDVPWWPGLVSAGLVVVLAVGTVEVMDGPDHLGHVLGLAERLMIVADLGWLVLCAAATRGRRA